MPIGGVVYSDGDSAAIEFLFYLFVKLEPNLSVFPHADCDFLGSFAALLHQFGDIFHRVFSQLAVLHIQVHK